MDAIGLVVACITPLKVIILSILMRAMVLGGQSFQNIAPTDHNTGSNVACEEITPSCSLSEMNYEFSRGA